MQTMLVQVPAGRSPGPSTWDDFVSLDEDDQRELIDGHLIQVEVPTQHHQYIIMMLGSYLTVWARTSASGTVLGSGYKVKVNRQRGVMPDIQFYKKGNLPKGAQQALDTGHPDLAVEVLSPSSRAIDRVTKLNWYASIGVPEYWLVDPESETLTRHLLVDGRYVVDPHGLGEVFQPDTFPGLQVPLAELWTTPEDVT